jgi:hypothetical protein
LLKELEDMAKTPNSSVRHGPRSKSVIFFSWVSFRVPFQETRFRQVGWKPSNWRDIGVFLIDKSPGNDCSKEWKTWQRLLREFTMRLLCGFLPNYLYLTTLLENEENYLEILLDLGQFLRVLLMSTDSLLNYRYIEFWLFYRCTFLYRAPRAIYYHPTKGAPPWWTRSMCMHRILPQHETHHQEGILEIYTITICQTTIRMSPACFYYLYILVNINTIKSLVTQATSHTNRMCTRGLIPNTNAGPLLQLISPDNEQYFYHHGTSTSAGRASALTRNPWDGGWRASSLHAPYIFFCQTGYLLHHPQQQVIQSSNLLLSQVDTFWQERERCSLCGSALGSSFRCQVTN